MSAFFVQGASAGSTANETSQAVTFTNPNSGADLLVVYFCWSGGGVVFGTISDTQGNAYTTIYNNANADQSAIFIVPSCKAGANTVTCTVTGGNTNPTGMIIGEFGGMSSTVDVAFSQTVSTATAGTTITTPAITNVFEYDLILGFFQGVNGTAVAPAALVAPVSVALDCVEYEFVNAVASVTVSNSSATGGFYSAGILAFRTAGGNMLLLGVS